jgi:hypothetical protein
VVVDALIEPSRLIRRGLGGQSGYERPPPGGQSPAQAGQEPGVGPGVLRPEVFKVHVHPLIAPPLRRADDLLDQLLLVILVLQQLMGQLTGETLVLVQIGQVEDRGHPVLEGGVHQGLVPEGDELILVKPVGEGGEEGQIGQGGPEQAPVNGGVGVGVDGEGPQGPGGVFDHNGLSGVEQVPALEGGVVPQKLGHGGIVHLGDGVQRIPRPDGVGQLGVLDHNGLPHHQPGGVGELIVLNQPLHGDAVLLGQLIHTVPRLNDMDVHKMPSFQTTVTNWPLAYPMTPL